MVALGLLTMSAVSPAAAHEEPLQARQVISGDLLAEYRPRIVVSDTTGQGPSDFLTGTGSGFDGVVKLHISTSEGAFLCSGSLLWSGVHVLTAAHCLSDDFGNDRTNSVNVFFETPSGSTAISAVDWEMHSGWSGDIAKGHDIALLTLDQPAPTEAERYRIYRDSDEVGQIMTKAGYGMTGTGSSGATTLDQLRRSGQNLVDDTDASFTNAGLISPPAGSQLYYDFDNGNSVNDAFGFFFGIHETGLGGSEVNTAGGDSGGPMFIDGQVAGITSAGWRLAVRGGPPPRTSDIDSSLNSTYGEFASDTRVSYYAPWIDARVFLPGDANFDGNVNALDLSIVANNWLANVSGGVSEGDFNADTMVNALDLSILGANWETSAAGGEVSFNNATSAVGLGVPEPSSMLLLGAGSLLLIRRRS